VNNDHGNVETVSVSVLAGRDGPSIPEPVVHPLTEAALNTSPIASSLERVRFRKRLDEFDSECCGS